MLTEERKKSDKLLLTILPKKIAEKLRDRPAVIAEEFENVSVLFADKPQVDHAIRIANCALDMKDSALDYALLRCAELTLQSGYSHFVVVESSATTKIGYYTTPTNTETSGSARVYGNRVYGSTTSTTTGGQIHQYEKPRQTVGIICVNFVPETEYPVLEAAFVAQSIRSKYRL